MSSSQNQLTNQQAVQEINRIYLEFSQKAQQIENERDAQVLKIFQQAEQAKLAQLRQNISTLKSK